MLPRTSIAWLSLAALLFAAPPAPAELLEARQWISGLE
jgi:hypothetical protein